MTKNTNNDTDNCINVSLRLKSIFVILLLLLLLIIECCNGIQSLNNNNNYNNYYCPVYCTCSIWYQLLWTSCAGKQLINVHTGVSGGVQALDLSNNSISKLADYEFTMIGMKKLKYLNISDNAISEIGLFAFTQLDELSVLDLSRNHFDYLHSDTFIDNNKLRILKIGGNNFHSGAPSLRSFTITDLDLSSCQIGHLASEIFHGIKQLRNLDISNNILIELDIAVLKTLSSLQVLKITRNPWQCNNAMNKLETYLSSKSIQYNSICEKNPHSTNTNNIAKSEKIILKPNQINNKSNNTIQNINNKFISLLKNINKHEDKSWDNITIELTKLLQKNNCTNNNNNNNNNNNTNNNNEKNKSINEMELLILFFIAGSIIGCALGMTSIYVWLLRQQENSTNRFSLLDNVSMQSDETLPTYCEVMSHSNLYPRRDDST